jgi:hypothetical protein
MGCDHDVLQAFRHCRIGRKTHTVYPSALVISHAVGMPVPTCASQPGKQHTMSVGTDELRPTGWKLTYDTPKWGVENTPPNGGRKQGQKHPRKGGSKTPPKRGVRPPLLGGWRYTKQCKFWRDSSVLIQGVRRFLRTPGGVFGVFFDPPKRTPLGWQTLRTTPKMGVFDPPSGGGVFTGFTVIPRILDDRPPIFTRVAQVVNTTRRSNPGSSCGTRNPDGADHMVGRG